MVENAMTLNEYILAEPRTEVTVVHQFRIALKLALAVLQYYSTPWLGEEWRISQLQLMPSAEEPPEDFPIYLHSKLFVSGSPISLCADNSVETTEYSLLAHAQHRGICNVTLFCLGMALLEIGHWKSLQELRILQFDDVDTARMLSSRTARLGKVYDRIIDKCLRTSFAAGTDLAETNLQKEIYREVVRPLEQLIERLDGLSET